MLLGYSPHSLSNDDSRSVYALSASTAHYTSDSSLWRLAVDVDGYWNHDNNQVENLIATSQFQYYLNTSLYQSWFFNLTYTYGKNLSLDKQITLGGESGLRGYPIHYQQGSKRVLLNLEKRYYWEYDLWRLFKVGGAAFYDLGKAYDSHITPQQREPYLHNVGLGLRLAPSRANSDLMLHLDVAVPINRPDDVDSIQWLFTVKNRF